MGAVTWSSPAQHELGSEFEPDTSNTVCKDFKSTDVKDADGIEESQEGDVAKFIREGRKIEDEDISGKETGRSRNVEEMEVEEEYAVVTFTEENEIGEESDGQTEGGCAEEAQESDGLICAIDKNTVRRGKYLVEMKAGDGNTENGTDEEGMKIREGNGSEEKGVGETSGERTREEGEGEEEDLETRVRKERKREEMEVFKERLAEKRHERKRAIACIAEEMRSLRKCGEELENEREERRRLEAHVVALKDVASISKEMLRIREVQVTDLKEKLENLQSSCLNDSVELRDEYDKQMENIRSLRELYDERAVAMAVEHQREIERERAKVEVLEIRRQEQETALQEKDYEIVELREEAEKYRVENEKNSAMLAELKSKSSSLACENSALSSQLSLINNLFSHLLTEPDLDFDKLTNLLQENHNLINDLTVKGDINETAALLVHITRQAEANDTIFEAPKESAADVTTTQKEIATNLPKVWRVLLELLSHYSAPIAVPLDVDKSTDGCYKDVETPYGTRSVISVSQTYLRLKDLILEKNSLVKEVGRLKTLNTHLESRLENQEKRLSVVSSELHKTWGVVSKLRMQHKQLHTSEQILRYELQHKRLMLNELKEELEYCRAKWEEARKMNSQSEEDWQELRKEFASRKIRQTSNSAESGYDEDDSGQNEETSDSPSEDADEIDLPIDDIEDDCPISDSISAQQEAASDSTARDIASVKEDLDARRDTGETVPEKDISMTEITVSVESPTYDSEGALSLKITSETESNEAKHLTSSHVEIAIASEKGSHSKAYTEECLKSNGLSFKENEGSTVKCTAASIHPCNVLEEEENSSIQILEQSTLPQKSQDDERNSAISKEVNNKEEEVLEVEIETDKKEENKTCEEILDARALRLKRLEEQCTSLLSKMSRTSKRGDSISNKLEQLHAQYGSSEAGTSDSDSEAKTEPRQTEETSTGREETEKKEDNKSCEEIVDARALRLKRLEEQCTSLLSKMTTTSERGDCISNKLNQLHDQHRSSEAGTSDSDSKIITKPCDVSDVESETGRKEDGESCGDILDARAIRLKKLEEQCTSLLSKMSRTSRRGDSMSNKLEQLHEQYGSTEAEAGSRDTTKTISRPRLQRLKRHSESTSEADPPLGFPEIEGIAAEPLAEQAIISSSEGAQNLIASSIEEFLNSLPVGPVEDLKLMAVSSDEVSQSVDVVSEQALAEEALNTEEILGLNSEEVQNRIADSPMNSPEIPLVSADVLRAIDAGTHEIRGDIIAGFKEEPTIEEKRSKGVPEKLDATYEDLLLSTGVREHSGTSNVDEEKIPKILSENSKDSPKEVFRSDELPGKAVSAEVSDIAAVRSGETLRQNMDILNVTIRNTNDRLENRAQRLTMLENQCQTLFKRVSITSCKRDALSNRLEELHEHYGSGENIMPLEMVSMYTGSQSSASRTSDAVQSIDSRQPSVSPVLNISSETTPSTSSSGSSNDCNQFSMGDSVLTSALPSNLREESEEPLSRVPSSENNESEPTSDYAS